MLSILRKGCLANTPYSELHVKTMMKMAVKNSMEIDLKFGDATFFFHRCGNTNAMVMHVWLNAMMMITV